LAAQRHGGHRLIFPHQCLPARRHAGRYSPGTGVNKDDLDIQAKDNAIRISGKKEIAYLQGVSVHRRERLTGTFDRTLTVPMQIDTDAIKAEYQNGILTLFIPRAESDKPRTIKSIEQDQKERSPVMSPQELQVQQKREVDKKQETTAPARAFVPATDIFETEAALTIVMEMPGTDKGNLDVSVEDGVLYVEGRVNFDQYDGLQPVYTEYNIGHYRRSFQLSNKIDQSKISAEIKDGVLTLVLPKAAEAKPRRIAVS
jgi:HSP20 family protein